MKIHVAKSNQSLNELARTLFKIRGRTGPNDEKKVIKELRRLNPQLKPNQPVAAGVPLVVPNVEGLRRADKDEDQSGLSSELLKQLSGALKAAGKVSAESIRNQKDRDAQMLKDVSANQRTLKAAFPEVHEKVVATAKAIKARAKDLDKESAQDKADLEQLTEDLKQMAKMAAG